MSLLKRLWWLLRPAPAVCPDCGDPAWSLLAGNVKGVMIVHNACSGCDHRWHTVAS